MCNNNQFTVTSDTVGESSTDGTYKSYTYPTYVSKPPCFEPKCSICMYRDCCKNAKLDYNLWTTTTTGSYESQTKIDDVRFCK